MNDVLVITEPDSVKTRAGGPATGNIWLSINGLDYPKRSWNDFIVVVMGWWAVALLHLLRSGSPKETVHFMDGPYSVQVSLDASGLLSFSITDGLHPDSSVAPGSCPMKLFVRELVSQSRAVLDACRRQHWWSDDADVLMTSIQSLREEAATFRERWH